MILIAGADPEGAAEEYHPPHIHILQVHAGKTSFSEATIVSEDTEGINHISGAITCTKCVAPDCSHVENVFLVDLLANHCRQILPINSLRDDARHYQI